MRTLFHLASAVVAFSGALHAADANRRELIFDQKLPPPVKVASPKFEAPFQNQFQADTGSAAETPRTEFARAVPLGPVNSQTQCVFKFDLAEWPEAIRSRARLWIAVAAPSTLSAAGAIQLTFEQAGAGMTTDLNNRYSSGGMMLLGSDFAVKDGAVSLTIDNHTHLTEVTCAIRALVYVPLDPRQR